MAIRVTFGDAFPLEAITKVRDTRLRGLCSILRQDNPRVLYLNPSANDCANVKAALRELQNEGIPLRTAGDCKRHRTAGLVLVNLSETFPLDPGLVDTGFIGLCKDTRPGGDSRTLVLRPTELEYADLKATLKELSDQAALHFTEEAICCICLARASDVTGMVAQAGLVNGTEISICADCVTRGLEKRDVVDSKGVLREFPRRHPAPIMRCDFCNDALDKTTYLLTGEEAYICDACLRRCGESLEILGNERER